MYNCAYTSEFDRIEFAFCKTKKIFGVQTNEDKYETPELIYKCFNSIKNADCKGLIYNQFHYQNLAFERKEFI